MNVSPDYRAPLGRTNVSVAGFPARWAGLRNQAPLALSRSAQLRPKGPSSHSPAQRAGYSCQQIMRPEGPR